MLHGDKIGGRIIGVDAAFVVTEDHVQDPVEIIFYQPMASDDRTNKNRP